MTQRVLNEKLSTISHVVVHPKYRTIGLGSKLVRKTLCLVGTPYVEMPAVMAKYNTFTEKAGMVRVAELPPTKEAYAIGETLRRLGFKFLSKSFSRSTKLLTPNIKENREKET